MKKQSTVKIESLVEDFNFYPRTQVSSTHVTALANALQSGDELPPIRVDRKSNRIIDGFHRTAAHKKLGREEIAVEWIDCKDDQELFELAVDANAGHGRPYTPFDRARIQTRAEELGFAIERTAKVLRMPIESLTAQRERAFAEDEQGNAVPLKRTIQFKAGSVLTERQLKANQKLSGMNARFYADQLSELFEADLVNWSDQALVAAFQRLVSHLNESGQRLVKAA